MVFVFRLRLGRVSQGFGGGDGVFFLRLMKQLRDVEGLVGVCLEILLIFE